MIDASEALLTPSAALSAEDRAEADALESELDQLLRTQMRRSGVSFDAKTTKVPALSELARRARAARYQVQVTPLHERSTLDPQQVKVTAYRLLLVPADEAYVEADSKNTFFGAVGLKSNRRLKRGRLTGSRSVFAHLKRPRGPPSRRRIRRRSRYNRRMRPTREAVFIKQMRPRTPSAPAPAPAPPPSASVLVPYRAGCPERARAWEWVRARYEKNFPAWEVVTAPGPDGEFSRASAVCDAAAAASKDVFVVADADVWCDSLAEAASLVAAGAQWVDPASDVLYMSESATRSMLAGGSFRRDDGRKLRRAPCGGVVVLSRDAFFRAPPDRRFSGWGVEDIAWAADLTRLCGPPARPRSPGTLRHVWHPPGPRLVSSASRRLLEEHVAGRAPPPPPPPPPLPPPPPPLSQPLGLGVTWTSARAGRPRVLVLSDVPGWAWAKKADALRRALSGEFDVSVAHSTQPEGAAALAKRKFDLLHTFEVIQTVSLPSGVPFVTGITAHVWQTWERKHGAGTVKKWASRALGFHANSKLLQGELEKLLGGHVWYVPNGVDEEFYRRERPCVAQKLVVGFVGKDNPRKGYDIVAEACKRAGVRLREVRRRSQDALSAEEMRAFYQDIHVLAVASDMDGTPNPALEAAACECVVVSNPIGNMPEFISHGENGLLTERSVDGLAGALASLAGKPLSEVEEMGRAARRTIEAEWTWTKMARNYADMWKAVLL